MKFYLGDVILIDYDLHIHSVYSDGVLEPEEIFKTAKQNGLKGLSITDHDTTKGLKLCEQLGIKYGLDFIPGIELSTEYNNMEIHVLGYCIDYNNEELTKILESIRIERISRMEKMLLKLKDLGYEISLMDIYNESEQDITGSSLGRPHLARALIRKGYFKNINEVFNTLLGDGKPAFVDRFKLNTIEGINLIKRFNGIPVLAHGGLIKVDEKQLENLVKEFSNHGLMGLEIYHSEHREFMAYYLTKLANKYKLLVSGGSDFHSPGSCNNSSKEISIGYRGVPSIEVSRMMSLIKKLREE